MRVRLTTDKGINISNNNNNESKRVHLKRRPDGDRVHVWCPVCQWMGRFKKRECPCLVPSLSMDGQI